MKENIIIALLVLLLVFLNIKTIRLDKAVEYNSLKLISLNSKIKSLEENQRDFKEYDTYSLYLKIDLTSNLSDVLSLFDKYIKNHDKIDEYDIVVLEKGKGIIYLYFDEGVLFKKIFSEESENE